MVELAGLSDQLAFVCLSDKSPSSASSETTTTTTALLSDHLRHAMTERFGQVQTIDFLFVDHAKELYLSDVQQLERNGFLKAGTAVAADNVVFFQLHDYRQHMRSLHDRGIVTTHLKSENIWLEYYAPDRQVEELQHANDPNLTEQPDPAAAELRDGLGTL